MGNEKLDKVTTENLHKKNVSRRQPSKSNPIKISYLLKVKWARSGGCDSIRVRKGRDPRSGLLEPLKRRIKLCASGRLLKVKYDLRLKLA